MCEKAKVFDAEVINVSTEYGQLAIQGPKARDLVQQHVNIDVSEMKPFEFEQNVEFFGKNVILSVWIYR